MMVLLVVVLLPVPVLRVVCMSMCSTYLEKMALPRAPAPATRCPALVGGESGGRVDVLGVDDFTLFRAFFSFFFSYNVSADRCDDTRIRC